jgi:hypothetical protein
LLPPLEELEVEDDVLLELELDELDDELLPEAVA